MYVASILPHHGSDIAQHDQCLQANSVWYVDLGNAANANQQLPEISNYRFLPRHGTTIIAIYLVLLLQ